MAESPKKGPSVAPKRTVVRLAEPKSDAGPPTPSRGRETRAQRPPTVWERYPMFARYPRVLGALLTLLGLGLVYHSLDVLENGGSYLSRSPVLGAVALSVGAWSLVFGCPLNDEGHPPAWWTLGFVASILLGFGFGFLVSGALQS